MERSDDMGFSLSDHLRGRIRADLITTFGEDRGEEKAALIEERRRVRATHPNVGLCSVCRQPFGRDRRYARRCTVCQQAHHRARLRRAA